MIRVNPRTDHTGTLPRVSVVVPIRNAAALLPECLESILDQSGVSVDVTVVDDASDDNSVVIVAEYARRDPRVRLARHDRSEGRIATLNEALGYATAGLVVVLEGEAVLTPGSLQRSARLMGEIPDLAFVYGRLGTLSAMSADAQHRERRSAVWTGAEWIGHVLTRGSTETGRSTAMIRRSALRATGGHRYDLGEGAHLNLLLRLASVGRIGRIDGPDQALAPAPSASAILTEGADRLAELHARLKAFDLFVDEAHPVLHDPLGLRAEVRHALARQARRAATRAHNRWRSDIEPVADYLAFARSLETKKAGHAPSVIARTHEDLQERLTWRRWRRAGI